MNVDELNRLSKKIIGIAIDIHKELGPGFNERIYSRALEIELKKERFSFVKEKEVKIAYKGVYLGNQRIDYLIEEELILELKAVPEINNAHQAQLLSYLKVGGKKLGLIFNFGKPVLEIKRLVNKL
jgi:GxxExxY protein